MPELIARREFPSHNTEKEELGGEVTLVEEVEISLQGGRDRVPAGQHSWEEEAAQRSPRVLGGVRICVSGDYLKHQKAVSLKSP